MVRLSATDGLIISKQGLNWTSRTAPLPCSNRAAHRPGHGSAALSWAAEGLACAIVVGKRNEHGGIESLTLAPPRLNRGH